MASVVEERTEGVEYVPLATGAETRITNGVAPATVVLANGGQARPVPGTWSATIEWLAQELAPRLPQLGFAEVRYRVKSWNRIDSCTADVVAAIELARERGAERVALCVFSMGGAVAARAARHELVRSVVALAPWFPDQLPLDGLRGRRLVVLHGALDRYLPGIPGVSAGHSKRRFEQARAAGVEGEYVLIPGGLHGTAIRAPWGVQTLPRAGRWRDLVAAELERFYASA